MNSLRIAVGNFVYIILDVLQCETGNWSDLWDYESDLWDIFSCGNAIINLPCKRGIKRTED